MIAHAVYEYDSRLMCYAKTLTRLGHTVDVIGLSGGKNKSPKSDGGVNLFPVQAVEQTKTNKTQAFYLRRVLSFFVRAALFVTFRDLKKHYDLVHVHSVPDFLVFAALFPKLRGAKIILDIHDILPEFYISKFGKTEKSRIYRTLLQVERLSAGFAHHVIIANDIWRAKLVSRSVRDAKCSAILNFPDREGFKRHGRNRNDHKVIVMYPGTLNQHQGLDIAIRAFDRIKNAVPSAEFHIYGVGPEEESLKRLVGELDLADRIKFLGLQPLKSMAGLMENADLGVVPKRDDAFGNEAFSTKIFEFMAMGVPVVVADTKVDRHYFDDSMVKFFAAGDERSLAEAMLTVIRKPGVRENLVRNASKFIFLNDWENNKYKYLDIVNRLASHGAVVKESRTETYV
ncbi:MAG: glycosyltransferase family 4 protein [Terriglobia bacterium]